MSHYQYLSEGISGKSTPYKSTLPVTISDINNNKKSTSGWLGSFFKSKPEKVKPVVFNKKSYAEEYYENFGIVYSGSDLGSSINSLF